MKTRISKRNIFGNYAKDLTKLEKDMDFMREQFLNLEISMNEYEAKRKEFMEILKKTGERMAEVANIVLKNME